VTRRLLLSYLALTLVVLVALEVPLGVLNAHNQRQDLRSKVERDAVAVGSLSEDALEHGRVNDARLLVVVSRYAEATDGRLVIVDASGRVMADSARAGDGEHESESESANVKGLSVTLPIVSNGRVLGTVHITYPTASTDRHIYRYWIALAILAALVLGAAAVVGLLLSRSLVRPLRRVEEAAERIGEGELDARAPERNGPEEVRRLARTVNETAAKLEALVASQQAFVADASHQLRTPLTALRLRLENLERDVAPEGRDSLAAAVAETDRLARLVSELLALARADDDVEPAGRIDIAALAAGRVDAWSALAEERGISIETRATSLLARGGSGRVEQVLDNLLANALEASPHGATIRITTARHNGWVELHVVDEGPGLAAVALTRAFDRFWHAGTGEGSGLGLPIARRLVAVDEGNIELLVAESGGVDAVVRLRPA
jgi:signal transduction histidine kinase